MFNVQVIIIINDRRYRAGVDNVIMSPWVGE